MSHSLDELITKFEELLAPDSFLMRGFRLYLSMECLDGLFDTLLNSRYVPKNVRIHLASIIQYESPGSAELIAILNKPIPELHYIDKKTRSSILPILEAFRAKVIALNSQHKGKYFKLDGTLKDEFVVFLKIHINNISSIQVVSYSPTTQVGNVSVNTTTKLEPEKLNELESIIHEYGNGFGETISMNWNESKIVDDKFKFGDAFSSQHCSPTDTSYKYNVGTLNILAGRGTAGGLITISPIVGGVKIGTITAVLTAAHVPYGWLNKNIDAEILSTFSNSCLFASYSRDEKKPSLDYAIMPVTEQFRCECEAYNTLQEGQQTLNDRMFGNLADVRSLWNNIHNYNGRTVHKRGIATLETQGILGVDDLVVETSSRSLQFKSLEDKPIFAKPGDSGAIVFLEEGEEENGLLYPIGVHYASDLQRCVHYSIPLELVLQDFCEKHCIDALDLTFENPKMAGTLRYDASRRMESAKQSDVEQVEPKLNIPYDPTGFGYIYGFQDERAGEDEW